MTHSQQDVLNEIMRLSRFSYQPPPPWMYSSFVRPSPPPEPRRVADTEIVPKALTEAPVASEGHAAAPDSTIAGATVAEVVPTWQALLDVTVWRSRPWWLRVAASVVVKRLNR